jgi:CheY-like chemotaxis protein
MTGADLVRVLLVEDNEDDAILVVNRLKRDGLGATFDRVETAEAFQAVLRDDPPDVVISDHNMPMFSADAALALLRESGVDVPFILVSGEVGEETASALMKAGAHDFVLKDRLARLAPAIQRELREAAERAERRRMQADLAASEERFRLLAEHAVDVIFSYRVRPEPGLEYVSPAITAITGRAPGELIADPDLLLSFVDPADRDAFAGGRAARGALVPAEPPAALDRAAHGRAVRRGRPGRGGRHPARHHQPDAGRAGAAPAGAAGAAGGPAGVPRPVGRRGGARLQQPAGRDQRLRGPT